MHLKVRHKTRYSYSEPVFLEPHYLYLYPLHRTYFKVIDYKIHVQPDPSGKALKQDPENNIYKQCWFDEMVSILDIDLELHVSSEEFNPFEFFLEAWPSKVYPVLLPYLENLLELDHALLSWVKDRAINAKENPVDFLTAICHETNREWDHEIRYETDLLHPNACFEKRKGSCRDLSWMLMQILRYEGIPARFVSGYAHNPELEEGHELHAWLEAWLPGAGWIGIDPSAGVFTSNQYIPLATSYDPSRTLPVQGSFRGDAVSTLETEVTIVEEE